MTHPDTTAATLAPSSPEGHVANSPLSLSGHDGASAERREEQAIGLRSRRQSEAEGAGGVRSSAIPWLGAIPAHWQVAPMYARYSVQLGKMLSPDTVKGVNPAPYLRNINIQWGRVDLSDLNEMDFSPEERQKYALRAGDLLVCEGGEVGRTAIWHGELEECFIQNAVHRVRPLDPTRDHGRFLYYVLNAAAHLSVFEAEGNRSTITHLTAEKLRHHRFAFPPLAEQRAIAAYLDHETARLDALVAAKERLIAMLREKRAALISRAVTRGLDPAAPMKDSGVSWLGAIPAHWQVRRLKHLTPDDRPIMYGIVLPGPNYPGGVPIVKGGDVTAERLRLDLLQCTSPEIESSYERSRLRTGDIVYAIRGSIGAAEIVPPDVEGANLTQDSARVAVRQGTYNRWLLYAVKSRPVYAQLDAGALGATIRGINIRDLKRALIAVPPQDEQRIISDYLDRETAKLDELVAAIRRHIEKVKEYRAALIAAAVTGKIDVRELGEPDSGCKGGEQ